MKPLCSLTLAGMLILGSALTAQAHFGMVIPSTPTVMETSEAEVVVDVKFWHPFDNAGMDMPKPLICCPN